MKNLTKIRLNKNLIERQKLNNNEVELVKLLHREKNMVFNLMKKLDPVKDAHRLPDFQTVITEIEFQLQETWHFPRNQDFHRFWILPFCSCPKMDNDDRWPIGMYWISEDCPVHNKSKG